MEHTWASIVRSVLTPLRFRGLLPIGAAGETLVAIDNVLEREPKAEADQEAVGSYLSLLEKDIERGPSALGRFRHEIVERWRKLVADVKVDRENDRIEGDVGL